MTTIPVANPLRSGNQRAAVGIGGLYANPRPKPMTTPYVTMRVGIGHGLTATRAESM